MAEEIEVLVVDDSPFIRSAVQRMLEPLAQVRVVGTASDGGQAVEMARRLRPDVIILDIVMPGMNGLEAIRGIMRETPTAILVLSSHARPGADVTLRALDLGAVDVRVRRDDHAALEVLRPHQLGHLREVEGRADVRLRELHHQFHSPQLMRQAKRQRLAEILNLQSPPKIGLEFSARPQPSSRAHFTQKFLHIDVPVARLFPFLQSHSRKN